MGESFAQTIWTREDISKALDARQQPGALPSGPTHVSFAARTRLRDVLWRGRPKDASSLH